MKALQISRQCGLLGGLALLASCSSQVSSSSGGQSGTDSVDQTRCETPRPLALDQRLPGSLHTVQDIPRVFAKTTLPGSWTWTEEPVELEVSIDRVDRAYVLPPGALCAAQGYVELEGRVRSSDDVIDLEIRSMLLQYDALVARIELAGLPERYFARPEQANVTSLLHVALTLVPRTDGLIASASLGDLAEWGWHGEPLPEYTRYQRPPQLEAACEALDLTGYARDAYTPLPSEAAARARMTGSWVMCQGTLLEQARVGFRVTEEGTWRDLVLHGDTILERGGFNHEGLLRTFQNEPPGWIQINASAFVGRLWQQAYVDGEYFFMPSSETFPSIENDSAPKERRGVAGCAAPEEELIPLGGGSGVAQHLTGRWVLCSGGLRSEPHELAFNVEGHIDLLDQHGALIERRAYEVIRTQDDLNPPTMAQLNLELESWLIELSERPLKLQVTQLPTFEPPSVAVFSAVP